MAGRSTADAPPEPAPPAAAAVGFGLGWLGESNYEQGRTALSSARPLLAWLFVAAALALAVGVRLAGGRTAGRDDVGRLTAAVHHGVGAGRRHALVGIALGMLLAFLLGPPVGSLAALVTVAVLAATPASRLLAGTVLWLADKVSWSGRPRSLVDARAVGVGVAVGLGLGIVFSGGGTRWVVVLVALGTVALLGRTVSPAAAPAVLLLVCCALAVVRTVPARADGTNQVTVHADKDISRTGVSVKAGQLLTLDATGSVRFLKDKRATAGPDGQPVRYQGCDGPGFCGALVGRIADGGLFLVGRHTSFTVTAPGELSLGVNDYSYSDNSGSFTVTVKVSEPAAAAAPVAQPDPYSGAPTVGLFAAAAGSTGHRGAAGFGGALGAVAGLLLGRGLGRRSPAASGLYDIGRHRRRAELPPAVDAPTLVIWGPTRPRRTWASVLLGPVTPDNPLRTDLTTTRGHHPDVQAVEFDGQVVAVVGETASVVAGSMEEAEQALRGEGPLLAAYPIQVVAHEVVAHEG
jgi:hypothetical protein